MLPNLRRARRRRSALSLQVERLGDHLLQRQRLTLGPRRRKDRFTQRGTHSRQIAVVVGAVGGCQDKKEYFLQSLRRPEQPCRPLRLLLGSCQRCKGF